VRGFPSAPERTRTSTDHTVHKALNLGQAVWMLPGASKSSKLRGSVDGLDLLDAVDVVTGVVTLGPQIGSERLCMRRNNDAGPHPSDWGESDV